MRLNRRIFANLKHVDLQRRADYVGMAHTMRTSNKKHHDHGEDPHTRTSSSFLPVR